MIELQQKGSEAAAVSFVELVNFDNGVLVFVTDPKSRTRWFKDYGSRADAFWELEMLGIVRPSVAQVLRADSYNPFPIDLTGKVISGFVNSPKQTLHSFSPFPETLPQ